MIRQAHTYMAGAMSGATLIAIAIAAFVLLVSAQVFKSWPIPDLGGGEGQVHVSDARAATSPSSDAAAASTGAAAGKPSATGAAVDASRAHRPDNAAVNPTTTAPAGEGPAPGSAPAGEGGGGSDGSAPAQQPGSTPGGGSPAGSGGGSNRSSGSLRLRVR